MKTDGKHDRLISRGIFILAVLSAASLLAPTSYSAEKDDEYLISLPEKKPATTKPKITTQKKEPAPQPAEPVKPVSRQSLLGGRASPDPDSTVEPAKNGRSGLMKAPGSGKKKTDGDEATAEERDPSLTKTVSRHSEGTTDYETTTEYDGDTEIVTEVVTEHNRGMIVETTTVTEKKGGKVVRKTKSKTTRKEGAASASTDKQTKTLLGRANDLSNSRNNGDVQAAQNTGAKPVSTANTAKPQTQTTGNTSAKPVPAGNTAKTTTGKETVAKPAPDAKEETPVVETEQKKEPVEESVPADEAKDPEAVQTVSEPEQPAESVETVPDDDKKEPDSDQEPGRVTNPFGVVRPMGGNKED